IQVVPDLRNLADRREPLYLRAGARHRGDDGNRDNRSEYQHTFHLRLPADPTRSALRHSLTSPSYTGKNTLCTNQYAPAAMTTSDPANATRIPIISLRRRTSASADATSRTMKSWPISTPTLKENSDQPSASRGRPNSRSTFAKPKPCTRPNVSAMSA